MIKATIIGGAGYAAGELLRILLPHPDVTIASVSSESQAGKPISAVHHDLLGTSLAFTNEPNLKVEVIFLCMGHGQSKQYLENNPVPKTTKIIDLSQDFRWQENASFGQRRFIYGLPEVNKKAIEQANSLANPGCFATGIQLGLLPLAAQGWLTNEVVVNAITGSTGAGQAPSATTHFSWRNNNLSTYKVFKHQHLVEIGQTLATLQHHDQAELSFIPLRGDFTRGILATLYTHSAKSLQEVTKIYREYYADQPFVHISEADIYLKQVVNTNNAVIQLQMAGDKLLITTAIDNLLKGASGQAVQNMNLMFGLKETTGLNLKGSIF
jgi:N-acetyl-gamma-glutamyl-phosphate reductase